MRLQWNFVCNRLSSGSSMEGGSRRHLILAGVVRMCSRLNKGMRRPVPQFSSGSLAAQERMETSVPPEGRGWV